MADPKQPDQKRKDDEAREPAEEAKQKVAKTKAKAEAEEIPEPEVEVEAAPEPGAEVDVEDAEGEPDEAEDAAASDGEPDEVEPAARKRGRRGRRGAAEIATPKAKAEPVRAAPRDASGAVAVRAQARYVRSAPRKARLVMDHIRGKDVAQARAILRHTPRAAAADISKLLESAVANAENNFELDPDDLRIGRAIVDEGPTLKRYRPRALGRATPIHKRTSHMTITLTTADER